MRLRASEEMYIIIISLRKIRNSNISLLDILSYKK